jgi:hypothetical protein
MRMIVSHESRQIKTRRGLAHLRIGNIFRLAQRLIDSGENHVFHDLRVRRIQRLRVNLDGRKRAITFGDDLDRAATAGGLDCTGREIRLDLFHLLLHFRSLLHEFADAGHVINWLKLMLIEN